VLDGESLRSFTVLVGGGMGKNHTNPDTFPRLADRLTTLAPQELSEVFDTMRHALGLPLPAWGRPSATGVLMLPIERSGRLVAVHGAEAARAVEGVTGVVISIGPGQEVIALPDGDRYLGFVFARAATPDAVEHALRQAWAALEVEVTAS
jgi:hypothetical protein